MSNEPSGTSGENERLLPKEASNPPQSGATLFQEEDRLLERAETICRRCAETTDLPADEYSSLTSAYRNLVRQTKKLVAISDSLQAQLLLRTQELRTADSALREANERLEQRVAERTRELESALGELKKLKDRLQEESTYLQQEIRADHNDEEIVGRSRGIAELLAAVNQVARTDATVLVLGETGTGKELVARAIHGRSARKDRPLVKVSCAVLPADLIESELFGHDKGAFTGASARRTGRFELADGGTIFLDEIAELPIALQPKLLRVLQEGEFERLGSSATVRVDVRVIAATNRDLEEAVRNREFREDLYYRLNVFPIRCPPLRERLDDVPLLVQRFLQKFCARTGKTIETVPLEAMTRLQHYEWPGNVRELENVIERAVIITRGRALELAAWVHGPASSRASAAVSTLAQWEREHILEALRLAGWKVRGNGGAAEALGMKPTTLESRMKKLGIKRPQ